MRVSAHYGVDGEFAYVFDTSRIMYQRDSHLIGGHVGKGLSRPEVAGLQIP
jgi:hypothetical protein